MSKEGSYLPIFIVLAVGLVIAGLWSTVPVLKDSIGYVLNPTAGWLLDWNKTLGMFAIVLVISIITILVQKLATDQKQLKELKKEQKILQGEMKKFRDHPEKLMELQKKQMEFIPKTMKLSMRAVIFTAVPFILFFQWFNDYFKVNPYSFLGFLSWFWFYLIFTMIFSAILKKVFDVV